jgi:DNA repair protein RecN (Recombination protein N)
LLRPDAALLTLDRLAKLEPERLRYAEALAAWREAQGDLERLEASLATFAERADYLKHAVRELDEAKLVAGEDEELGREAARLAHADRLRELTQSALGRLSESDESVVTALAAARHAIEQAAALDASLEAVVPSLDEAAIAAADAARTLQGYADGLEADPAALERVEARRDLIARLTRKYRRDVPELLQWRAQIAADVATGEDAEPALARARGAAERAQAHCLQLASALGKKRTTAAAEWGPRLTKELKPLGLAHGRIVFELEPLGQDASKLGPFGLDLVRLQFGANPGEPLRPLAKIASGGELSRVMLALKAALEAQDSVDVLLFDEVDSGIGGAVAQAVGERLRRLSRHRQIVCVTHEPMIAAQAGHHLRVTKQVSGGRTLTRIEPVEGNERVAELARMLAGERASETTRRQARELLEPGARSGAR